MRNIMEVKINPGFGQRLLVQNDLTQEFARILLGSLSVTNGGPVVAYADRWSGARFELTKTGGDLSGIDLFAPVMRDGGAKMMRIADIDFPRARPDFKEFRDGLDAFHDSNGEGDPLEIVAGFRIDLDHMDDATGPPTLPSFRFEGGSGPDEFRLGDAVNFMTASGGDDLYRGGRNFDTISYADMVAFSPPPGTPGISLMRAGGGRVEVEKPDGSTDTLSRFEGIFGTNGDDMMRVPLGNGGVRVFALGGDDVVGGGRSADQLQGGEGDDVVLGRGGDDLLFGDGGGDILRGGPGADILVGGYAFDGDGARDVLIGGGGADLYVIGPFNSLAPADVIRGFRDGFDFIGLAPGVRFADLVVTARGRDAVLSVSDTDIAVVKGVDADAIDRDDFVLDFTPPFDLF